MTTHSHLISIGNSTGLTIPKEILTSLKMVKGDDVVISAVTDGFMVTKSSSITSNEQELMQDIFREYGEVFKKLADA